MKRERLFFLPGNGHSPMRLRAARRILERDRRGPDIIEAHYETAKSFGFLLDELSKEAAREDIDRIYATGIGALVALAQRARGHWLDKPLILQGAVLWGLEQRLFPRLMKHAPLPWLLAKSFGFAPMQRHFVNKYLLGKISNEERREFFAGYRDASSFAAWFRWLNPGLLRGLEHELGIRGRALENLVFWWGERDRVVGVEELRLTERALDRSLPLRTFPEWGHYPMIDDPEAWAREVHDVARTRSAS